MLKVLLIVNQYLYPNPGILDFPCLLHAIFLALQAVVNSNASENGNTLSINDETTILNTLFILLVQANYHTKPQLDRLKNYAADITHNF